MIRCLRVLDLDLAARTARRELAPVNLEETFVRERGEMIKSRNEATCRRKVAYRSSAAARNAEILRLSSTPRALHGNRGRPYHCPVCGRWHLTTKPLEDRR